MQPKAMPTAAIESVEGTCQSCGRRRKVYEVFAGGAENSLAGFGRTGAPATWWLCSDCLRRTGSAPK
jgi:hypothetical protein